MRVAPGRIVPCRACRCCGVDGVRTLVAISPVWQFDRRPFCMCRNGRIAGRNVLRWWSGVDGGCFGAGGGGYGSQAETCGCHQAIIGLFPTGAAALKFCEVIQVTVCPGTDASERWLMQVRGRGRDSRRPQICGAMETEEVNPTPLTWHTVSVLPQWARSTENYLEHALLP